MPINVTNLKRELEKNEDIDLPTALKLLHTESKKPVTVGTEHTMVQIGIQNLARITTNKKGKVNYIEQSSRTNGDVSTTDSCYLSQN